MCHRPWKGLIWKFYVSQVVLLKCEQCILYTFYTQDKQTTRCGAVVSVMTYSLSGYEKCCCRSLMFIESSVSKKYIYPSIFISSFFLLSGHGGLLESLPAITGWSLVTTCTSGHFKQTIIHNHTDTVTVNLELIVCLTFMFWTVAGREGFHWEFVRLLYVLCTSSFACCFYLRVYTYSPSICWVLSRFSRFLPQSKDVQHAREVIWKL